MTALDPLDLELLYFLCAASHHHCRVVRVKGPRLASLRRLREAGFVGADDFIPSPNTIADWLLLRSVLVPAAIETPAEGLPHEPTVRPAPKAVDEGGRRCCSDAGAPPPNNRDVYDAIATFAFAFGDKIPKERAKGGGPPNMAERARRFEEQRSAKSKKDTQGASGTARKAPGAAESTAAKRITDRAPIEEPAPTVAPLARARPSAAKVDIKVNARRDPTQAPPTPYSPEKQDFMRGNAARLRAGRAKAEAFLDSGKTSQDAGSVSLRIEARKVEIDRAEEARRTDPLEQAKVLIRRAKRCAVFGAEVSGGPAGKFYVGTRLVTEAELLAMAKGLAA